MGCRPSRSRWSTQIFSFGELGFQEIETNRYLIDILEEERLHRAERRRRHSDRVHGDLGIGQAGARARLRHRRHPAGVAEAGRRLPRADDRRRAGSRRRHNSGQALNITAAIAVKKIMEREKLPGTIRIWTGTAEELVGTKAYFVRAGLFKDVDVALFTHVGNELGVSWGDRDGTGLVSVQYSFRGETRARGRRAVARPQRARRRGADGHRLELPPRAPAARAALALRHHRRRRPAQRRPADRVGLVLLPPDHVSEDQGAVGDRRRHGQGRGDDDRHRAAADRRCSAAPGRSTSTRSSPRRRSPTSRRSACRPGARPTRRSPKRCRRSSEAREQGLSREGPLRSCRGRSRTTAAAAPTTSATSRGTCRR